MAPVSRLELGVVGLVVGTLVLTGPVVGVVDVATRNPTTVGDGGADATVERLDTDGLVIDQGRFGAGVLYLRIPEATVSVDAVEGRPRIVYQVRVPSLGVDAVETKLLTAGDTGTVRLDPRARGLDPAAVDDDRYVATVDVRVQSFEGDETIYRANETVEVRR